MKTILKIRLSSKNVIGALLLSSCTSVNSDRIEPPDKITFNCLDSDCVYYRIDSFIYPIKQPTLNSCWATTLTMLLSYKGKKQLQIEQALKLIGPKYLNLFKNSDKIGIGINDELALYDKADINIMQQLNPSIDGWEYYLKEYGPLAVTIDANPPYGGTIHSILVTGIYGKKDGKDTKISFVDPFDGKEHLIDFIPFVKMYEAKYSVDWLVQVIYLKRA